VRELTGGETATINNRMELQAAISALKSLKEK
jgi:ribonuclease HI